MFITDSTQEFLSNYLKETELTANECLRKYDYNAKVTILPSIDVGFPHEVIRLAGGFATGMYIFWESKIPFLPVDSTVNVCSTSIYELNEQADLILTSNCILDIEHKLENSIYKMNFNSGNHFVSYMKGTGNKKYLVLHSSAKEFKGNFNGLYPVEGNWFYGNIKTFFKDGRYFRYLIGEDAELFYKMAEGVNAFNKARHDFFAHLLTNGSINLKNSHTWHHYGMPSYNSVIIGSYLVNSNDPFPILTKPGQPILIVRVSKVKDPSLKVGEKILVPHGWGKQSLILPKINLDLLNNRIILNDQPYNNQFGVSIGKNESFITRNFSIEAYLKLLDIYFEYEVLDMLDQIISYNKSGIIQWQN